MIDLVGDIIDSVVSIKIGLYLGHVLTLLLFLTALILIIKEVIYVHNTLRIYEPNNEHTIKSTLYTSLYSSVVICVVFIILQLDWVISDYNSEVGNTTSYLWLVFDVFLGIFFISFTVFTSGVRSKLEYIDRLEKVLCKKYCERDPCNDRQGLHSTIEDGNIIKDSVEESKAGLELLKSRVLHKDDNMFNSDNGCRK